MKLLQTGYGLLLFTVLYGCTTPSEPDNSLQTNVSIPFLDHGGIKDWRAVSEKEILVKSRNNQWYRATFRRRCFNLNDRMTRKVIFKPGVTGSFGEHSEVIVDEQRCRVKTIEKWINPDELREQTEDGDYVSSS